MAAVAGAEPRLTKIDVGLFVPGTPMASDVGVEITRRPDDYEEMKKELFAAGYRGERVVVLAVLDHSEHLCRCRRSPPMFCSASA